MLHTLTIRDFVIVESMELGFSDGFTVLTDETSAGKSILVDALQLALGGVEMPVSFESQQTRLT